MKRGRPVSPVVLAHGDGELLERWARSHDSRAPLAQRARIVLAAARGLSNREVAEQLGLTPQTVGKWRARYLVQGIEGLVDRPLFPERRCLGTDVLERVESIVAGPVRGDGGTWSTRSVAGETGLSQSKISRILRSLALLPGHDAIARMCRSAFDAARVSGVAGILLDPPDCMLALAMVPAPFCESHADPAAADGAPVAGGEVVKPDSSDAVIADLIARALKRAALGRVRPSEPNHAGRKFAERMAELASGVEIRLILDPGALSRSPAQRRRFARQSQVKTHVVPHGMPFVRVLESWLAWQAQDHGRGAASPDSRSASALHALRDYASHAETPKGPFVWIEPGATA